jgi:sulfotransferase
MSSPVADVVFGVIKSVSRANEFAAFISDRQRERMVKAVIDAYYCELLRYELAFDTSRGWCAILPALVRLYPATKAICCVRNPAWILDSIERSIQNRPFESSRMFQCDPTLNVYNRVDSLVTGHGIVGSAVNALRQAWFGENAPSIIAVRYESLTRTPEAVLRALYAAIEEPYFDHSFDNLDYDQPGFDAELGLPGFHKVKRKVEARPRTTILPSDLFDRYNRGEFWNDAAENPRGVSVL